MKEKTKQSTPYNNNEERISLSNLDGFTSHYQEMNIFNHLKQRNTRHNLLHPVLSSCNPKSMKMLLLSGDKELYHAPKTQYFTWRNNTNTQRKSHRVSVCKNAVILSEVILRTMLIHCKTPLILNIILWLQGWIFSLSNMYCKKTTIL